MGLHARHLVIKGSNHGGHRDLRESFLELAWHVIGKLTNAVKGCVSNLGVLVGEVLQDNRDHTFDLLNIINVLTDLGE